MPAVLLIEDDGVIARVMSTHLRHAGFDVEWAEDGERGLRKLRYERPDIAVVDLMLPGLDGWAVTEAIRRERIPVPIIVVSARGSEHDKVHTLGIGADDYLAKPFGMRELVARVQAAAAPQPHRSGRAARRPDPHRRPAHRPRPAPRLPRRRAASRTRSSGPTPASRRPSSGCCSRWRARRTAR